MIDKNKKNISPLSIKSYGTIFIILTLLSFSAVTLYSTLKIKSIKINSNEKTVVLAEKELREQVKSIKQELENTANTLLNWEELKQQFTNATYYSYWHKSRLPSASFLPTYFKTVELYDIKGKPKSGQPVSIRYLTDGLRVEGTHVNPEKDTIYQIRRAENNQGNLLGYVIIEYHLAEVINKYNYQYIDKNTLQFKQNSKTFPLEKLNESVKYQLNINDAFNDLQQVMFYTIINLTLIGALIAVMLWIVISYYSGRPLQILANHIDAIKYGEFNNLELNLKSFQTTKEFETVKDSFNRFQQLLANSESALKYSESRLQSVLENISIGIITFDENFIIESCNAEILDVFGYAQSELIGNSMNLLFDNDTQKICHYQVEKAIKDTDNNSDNDPVEITGLNNKSEYIELSLDINRIKFAGKNILIAIIRDISHEKRAHEKLEFMANYDALTSLPNRVLFQDRLIHATDQAKRKNNSVGLLFLDLDRFKLINDSLGHHIGDLLLKQVANRIRTCIREGDTVARLGGDEFTIINEDIYSRDESINVATRINQEIRKPFILEGNEHFISTSIGITFFPEDADKVDELIKHADAAMYKAKESGGDNYQLFTAEMSQNTSQRMLIENKLRHAIENQEFELFYQPRIALDDYSLTSFEALIRWNDQGKHRASPQEFIPILEDTGMIINVGNWVINEACIQIKHWMQSDLNFSRIAINLSGRQFKYSSFLDDVDEILNTHNIQPSQIEFEITESLLIDNVEETQIILQNLHDRGFHISIDDFGTGYSSLAYLKQFPIDTIKIDQCFIRNYPDDHSDIAIIESIIAIAANLGMQITAEGVENIDQLLFLRDAGCHEAQGFYFAKPMPAAIVQTWLKQYRKADIKKLNQH